MKKAILYRMVTDKHICPYGIKSLDLLKRQGFTVEDVHLTNREETDVFKNKHNPRMANSLYIERVRHLES